MSTYVKDKLIPIEKFTIAGMLPIRMEKDVISHVTNPLSYIVLDTLDELYVTLGAFINELK